MRLGEILSHPASLRRHRSPRLSFFLLLLLSAAYVLPLRAQEAAPPTPSNSAPYILHLYARLVELPTIILLPEVHASNAIDPRKVDMTLDGGRPFHPLSIRLEGDDPLSVAVLLDVTGDNRSMLSQAFSKNFSAWVSQSFKPHDRLSIYSLNCDLYRGAINIPPIPSLLQPAVDRAIPPPSVHPRTSHAPCPRAVSLRDSIYFVMRQLSANPGRHVLIILTDGKYQKGAISWSELASAATLHAVTLFSLVPPSLTLNQWASDLSAVTEQSGGFFRTSTPDLLPTALARFVELLRTRYILQFSIPKDLGPGLHHVDVTLTGTDATIRPSGITVPLVDPTLDHPATDLPSALPPDDPNR